MVKRGVAIVLVVIITGLSGSAPAVANPYDDQLCMNNPAYRSMHENDCDLNNKNGQNQGPGGLLGLIHHLLGGLL